MLKTQHERTYFFTPRPVQEPADLTLKSLSKNIFLCVAHISMTVLYLLIPFVCLSVCLSVYLSVCLCVCPSVCLSFFLSVCVSFCICLAAQGCCWHHFNSFGRSHGWALLGSILGPLGEHFGCSGTFLGALGGPWGSQGFPWSPRDEFWVNVGVTFGSLWNNFWLMFEVKFS